MQRFPSLKKLFLTLIFISASIICLSAQTVPTDNEDSGKKKYPLILRGGLNIGGELYSVSGIPNRRSPWAYHTQGNLGISIGKFRVPISFTYRDRQFSYDFTFNRIGLSPTIGWATVHLGWRNMSFSPYTLGGRTFYGVGTELRPGKLYIGGLYGELKNPLAIRDSLVFGANLIPIFDRKLYGAKIGYRNGKNHFELMGVKIWDDPNSFDYPDNYDELGYNVLTPKENIVLGINGGIGIAKFLEIYFRSGLTLFTGDVDDPLTDVISGSIPDQYRDILTINSSSRITYAGDAGLNITVKGTRIGLQYRRVEPFYTTLATNFFPNDLEQYTFLLSTGLLKRKLLLNGRIGLEQNNLRDYRTNTTRRFIGNLTATYRPDEDWNFNLRYANFTTDSEANILELNDTLRYVTVSNNASVTGTWTKRGQSRDLILTTFLNYQAVDDQSVVERISELDSYAGTLTAAWRWQGSQLSVGPSFQLLPLRFKHQNPRTIWSWTKHQQTLLGRTPNGPIQLLYLPKRCGRISRWHHWFAYPSISL